VSELGAPVSELGAPVSELGVPVSELGVPVSELVESRSVLGMWFRPGCAAVLSVSDVLSVTGRPVTVVWMWAVQRADTLQGCCCGVHLVTAQLTFCGLLSTDHHKLRPCCCPRLP